MPYLKIKCFLQSIGFGFFQKQIASAQILLRLHIPNLLQKKITPRGVPKQKGLFSNTQYSPPKALFVFHKSHAPWHLENWRLLPKGVLAFQPQPVHDGVMEVARALPIAPHTKGQLEKIPQKWGLRNKTPKQ